MNIIELATQRLQELSRTGIQLPVPHPDGHPPSGRIGTVPHTQVLGGDDQNLSNEQMQRQEFVGSNGQPQMDSISHTIRDRSNGRHSESVTLDLDLLEEAGVLASTKVRSTIAEEFRHIKRPLLDNVRKGRSSQNGRPALIMVTSALPGEGKTFFALNLAVSMAIEIDTSVLLVDGDVVRCNLMRSLGLQARKGLLDVLTNPSLDVADVMLKTNIPRLSLLPAGTSNMRSTEILASEAMSNFLEELANRYKDRVVIFDSTPLLLTSEAKVLAAKMGQVLVVVEESRTSYADLQKAFAAVESCPTVMSVLNKDRNTTSNYASYYA